MSGFTTQVFASVLGWLEKRPLHLPHDNDHIAFERNKAIVVWSPDVMDGDHDDDGER